VEEWLRERDKGAVEMDEGLRGVREGRERGRGSHKSSTWFIRS